MIFTQVQQGSSSHVGGTCISMLPDPKGLRKQTLNSDDLRSPKRSNGKVSSQLKISDENSGSSASRPYVELEGDLNHPFFSIWIAQPSWSPLTLTDKGWTTIKSKSGKPVPLKLDAVKRAYKSGRAVGKRFGKLTNYLMLDIDINSPFHPRNQGLSKILNAMESLGLTRYIIVRSSQSGGLHIYFPLAEPVYSYAIANAAHAVLTQAGIEIKGGICELFPNKKAYEAEHNGHRLPLQAGSYILDESFNPISNSKAAFVQMWQSAAEAQAEKITTKVSSQTFASSTQYRTATGYQAATGDRIPPIAWTGYGQSNEVMRQLVNYGDGYAGMRTVESLAEWIIRIAPQLPGYEEFASKESKHDLQRRNWAWRWAICHFKKRWEYIAKTSDDYNQAIADQAKQRIFIALKSLGNIVNQGRKKLWEDVCNICRRTFGLAPSYRTFMKYWSAIANLIEGAGDLTPSLGLEEDKNSFSKANSSQEKLSPENCPPRLITARSDPNTQSKDLSRLHTPVKQAIAPAQKPENDLSVKPVELKKGQQVTVKLSGCLLDGLKTWVRGKTKDALGRCVYRLNHRVGGEYLVLPMECLNTKDMLVRQSSSPPI